MSEYGAALLARREALCSALVAVLSRLPPDDPNFQLALHFTSYHTRRHAFLDTDPWEVERQLDAWEGAFSMRT